MGNELFGIDLAGIIGDAIGDGVFPVTITRQTTTGQRDPANLTGGFVPSGPMTWGCQGFFDDFTGTPPPTIELHLGDRRLVLIGDTIPADLSVAPNDKATVHEDMGDVSLFVAKLIKRDPAGAVYEYLCRDRGTAA